MTNSIALTLALTLFASVAHAQVAESVYAASAAADHITTYRLLSQSRGLYAYAPDWRLREHNPLTRWIDTQPATHLALSVAADTALTVWLHRKLATKPRLRTVLYYTAASARTYLAVRNAHVLQKHQRWAQE